MAFYEALQLPFAQADQIQISCRQMPKRLPSSQGATSICICPPTTSLVSYRSLSHSLGRLLHRDLPRCRKLPPGFPLLMTGKVRLSHLSAHASVSPVCCFLTILSNLDCSMRSSVTRSRS